MNDVLEKVQNSLNLTCGISEIDRLCFIIVVCSLCSILIIISSLALYKLFEIDLFNFKSKNIRNNWGYWILGSVSTYLILLALNIVTYSLPSIIIVCFTWNILLKSTFDKIKSKPEEKAAKELDAAIESDIDDSSDL